MERHPDPYSVLEVNTDASPREITEAYHTLLRVWQPERFEDSELLRRRAAERCQLIHSAFRQLTGEEQMVEIERGDLLSKVALLVLVVLSVSLAALVSVAVILWLSEESNASPQIAEPQLLEFVPQKRPSSPRILEAVHAPAPSFETGLESNLFDPKPSLVRAAIDCDVERLRELLTRRADVHQADRQGETALAWAVKRNCMGAVRELLARGARATAPATNGYSPLRWAQVYDHYQIELLLRRSNEKFSRFR